jgi:hypothetical protein
VTPAKSDATNLTGTLEIARRELLDLGLRNTLLNHRPKHQKGVELIDETPAEEFRLLVKEERSMTFLPGEAGGLFANATGGDDRLAQSGR